ncbi:MULTISPECIES: cassette chromosome ssDNA-binding protein [Staphylococcus]|uniref:Uncharacterized protein n=1 Tax=Staphylococcus auricularis TaxID=29379 RepID=A0ABX5IC16_9STAP|nr:MULTISPECIES: hypothetical protein [Staphylococcus]PTF95291.1 hypothetical protein BU654_05570 [Staphylococcus chromogenes]PTH13096.1 hypothetical protein BU607_09975 [Staphylococcus auricularis]RIL98925.1 hypothetical protein BU684_07035 [Staphylococcus chromogenes]
MKSNAQNFLYRASIAVAYQLPENKCFHYSDLRKSVNHMCNTADQQEAARRFAYWVKNADVPFVIVDHTYPITYKKVKGGSN